MYKREFITWGWLNRDKEIMMIMEGGRKEADGRLGSTWEPGHRSLRASSAKYKIDC